MKIWDHIPDELPEKTALCIGKFDGFHRGHQVLIDEALSTGCRVAVLTFVFNRTDTIDSIEEKREIARLRGVEEYIEIEAGRAFFSLTPTEFIRDIVCEKLHAAYVIVGEDFRFGRDRAGDIGTLEEYSGEYGYRLIAVPKLKDADIDISSSRIRECIERGEMGDVERLLGRPYSMTGKVVYGNHIGRTIGAPTANLIPERGKVLPPFGVYAVRVVLCDQSEEAGSKSDYVGIANLGVKPTISEDNPVGLEINIFDYEGDIYEERVSVEFIRFIRSEKRFASVDELKVQIEKDIAEVKETL